MAWWQWTLAAVVLAYFPAMSWLALGFHRLARSTRLEDSRCVPVSVVVSARNEARDLPRCIASLLALDYPATLLQIVLVDDHSDDATGDIVDAAAAQYPRVLALHAAALPPNGLEAKARGIAHGFARATGEWVFITDADAAVHPQWIRHLLGRAAPDTGMVGGTLAVEANGAVGILECVSWAYVQRFSLGLAGWGVPFACLGPNMAIRRSVYEATGGLERATFRVAEDLALFAMVTQRRMSVQSFADPETTATLRPVPSVRHLVSQQRRWLAGGLSQAPAFAGPLLAAFWWGFLVAAYLLLGWALSWGWWLAFVVAKALLDAFLLASLQRRLELRRLLRYLWVLELYHAFIFFILPPSFLFSRRIQWMGDGYAVTYD
jgi:cellulose synthase/poly-beta-1,6-N-acetylglucosamine synthase-like glycosyltransferase